MDIVVIPDLQIKKGVPMEHLEWIGKYIVKHKPDVIVNIGDMADMPSLNSHVRQTELVGQTVVEDLKAVKRANYLLLHPINSYNRKMRKQKMKQYKPKMVLTLGNHEDRLYRLIKDNPALEGSWGDDPFGYKEAGWEVIPYHTVYHTNGVHFCHEFLTTSSGRGPASAKALLNRRMSSCIMGHRQGLDWAHSYTPLGKKLSCIIAGSAYIHDENYMSQQNVTHWRGIIHLHDVFEGEFDEEFITMDRLMKEFYEFLS